MFTNSSADRLRVLQRALEAPMNVGRRTLQTLAYHDSEDDKTADDTKHWVVNEFHKAFEGHILTSGFEDLLNMDKKLTQPF